VWQHYAHDAVFDAVGVLGKNFGLLVVQGLYYQQVFVAAAV
jgi:hypothetical protein